MAKLFFGMNQSLDGYVNHEAFAPGEVLFRHFIDQVKAAAGLLYGRGLYEVMRYWDEDDAGWGAEEREYAQAWRAQHKWVVSRTLKSVGPNTTLISDDLDGAIRKLKADHEGEFDVGGPGLAQSLADLGLLDGYHIYLRPVVMGEGKRFFAGKPPPLRLAATERIGDEAIRLTYEPV